MEVGAGYRSGSGAEALPAVLELVTRRLFRGFFSHLPRDAFSGFRSEGRSESGAAVGAGVMRGEQGGEGVSPGEGGGALPGARPVNISKLLRGAGGGTDGTGVLGSKSKCTRPSALPLARDPGGGASGLRLPLRLSTHPAPRTWWVPGHPQLPCYLSGGSRGSWRWHPLEVPKVPVAWPLRGQTCISIPPVCGGALRGAT